MKKKPDPEMIDEDNPEWTAKMFRQARPAREVLPPEFFTAMENMKRKRGRPPVAKPKRQITLRLPDDLVETIRAGGQGYNARVEKALRAAEERGEL